MKPRDQYLSTTQVAERCGVAAKTVARWVDSGILTAIFTSGGHRRIRAQDLELFLTSRRSLKALSKPQSTYRIILLTTRDELKAIATSVARQKDAEVHIVESVFEAGIAVAQSCPHLFVVDTSVSLDLTESITRRCEKLSKNAALPVLLVGDTEMNACGDSTSVIERLDHALFSQILDGLPMD